MTFYNEIELIYPYLKSVRKLKTYLSFDILFPEKWNVPKKFIIEGKYVQQESQVQGMKLLSFVSEFSKDEVDLTIKNIKSIIEFNKELEQKELLFTNKVEELKRMFEKQDINKLKTLKFEINEFNLTIQDEEPRESDELVEERSEKG